MYQGKKKKTVMPMAMQGVQQGAPLGASPIDNTPTMAQQLQAQAVSTVGGRVMNKGLDKGMEMAAPLMDKGMSAMSNMFAPAASEVATGAMGAGVDAGIANAMAGAAPTASGMATGAAGAGMMGALGTAMPWLGAGMLGGKMLGLFSEGGLIGPLSGVKYKSNGGGVSDEYQVSFVNPLSAK